jgi:hypothetical protein
MIDHTACGIAPRWSYCGIAALHPAHNFYLTFYRYLEGSWLTAEN